MIAKEERFVHVSFFVCQYGQCDWHYDYVSGDSRMLTISGVATKHDVIHHVVYYFFHHDMNIGANDARCDNCDVVIVEG